MVCPFFSCSVWSSAFDSGAKVQKAHVMIQFNHLKIHLFFLGHGFK